MISGLKLYSKGMEKIIDKVARAKIKPELTRDKLLRVSGKGGNEMYLLNDFNAKHTVREIGRLRELSFRAAGGGTGKGLDLDNFDVGEKSYDQLIVWSPSEEEIIGGYRILKCSEARRDEKNQIDTCTSEIFEISEDFENTYIPYTLELGRSFVHPSFQVTGNTRKSPFAFNNLWEGLGKYVSDNADIKYLFGKMTLFPNYNATAKRILLSYFYYYYEDEERLVFPKFPAISKEEISQHHFNWEGKNARSSMAVLSRLLAQYGQSIPPIMYSYLNITDKMKVFGTSRHESFGDVEELCIFLALENIFESKKVSYIPYRQGAPHST